MVGVEVEVVMVLMVAVVRVWAVTWRRVPAVAAVVVVVVVVVAVADAAVAVFVVAIMVLLLLLLLVSVLVAPAAAAAAHQLVVLLALHVLEQHAGEEPAREPNEQVRVHRGHRRRGRGVDSTVRVAVRTKAVHLVVVGGGAVGAVGGAVGAAVVIASGRGEETQHKQSKREYVTARPQKTATQSVGANA